MIRIIKGIVFTVKEAGRAFYFEPRDAFETILERHAVANSLTWREYLGQILNYLPAAGAFRSLEDIDLVCETLNDEKIITRSEFLDWLAVNNKLSELEIDVLSSLYDRPEVPVDLNLLDARTERARAWIDEKEGKIIPRADAVEHIVKVPKSALLEKFKEEVFRKGHVRLYQEEIDLMRRESAAS